MANRRIEEQLEALSRLRGSSAAAAGPALRKALADRVNLVAAKAANIAAELPAPGGSSRTCCGPSTASSKTPSNAIRNVGARTPSPGRSRISAIASRPPFCAAPCTFRWSPYGAARRTPPDPFAASACWRFPPAPTWRASRYCGTWSTRSPKHLPPFAPTRPAPSPKCRATIAPCCSASRRAPATPKPAVTGQVLESLLALERRAALPFVRQFLAAGDRGGRRGRPRARRLAPVRRRRRTAGILARRARPRIPPGAAARA